MVAKHHTVLRFAQRGGGGVWVKGASFKPGSGMRVSKVSFTRQLREAAPMSRVMAQDIATQFYRHVVSVHRSDTGELIPDATSHVQVDAARKRAADARARSEFNQFLNEACDAVPGLRAAIERGFK